MNDPAPESPEHDAEPTATGRPTVVSVVGPSDAGKTTLVEALCGALSEQRVATVKSIHHDIEPDTPGTDTHRHRTAGADAVVGITPSLTFEISRGGKGDGRDPAEEVDALRRSLARLAATGYDIVIVEGFSGASLPTIRVGEATDFAGDVVGTDEDELSELVAAIEALDPIAPATVVVDGERS